MLIGIDASRALRAERTGTERYSLEIIRHLLQLDRAASHQWRLYVDTPADAGLFPKQSRTSDAENVELRHLPRQPMWTHRQLAGEIRRAQPDILFVPAHVLPFRWAGRRRTSTVVTVHDLGHRHFAGAHTRMQRLYLELSTRWNVATADRVIAVSHACARDISAAYGRSLAAIDVIHEAGGPITALSDARISATLARYGLQQPYFYFVGTIQPRKNLVRLIEAYTLLRRHSGQEWPLVLAGKAGWKYDEIVKACKASGFEQQIRLLGFVPDDDASALSAAAHSLCFPSLFEGFGLPVLEAQQRGIPVMTANSSSLPEIGGKGALYVDPLNVEEIADAMLRLSNDEALRQRLIAAGYENIKRFSWEKAAEETLAVLEQAARPKP